MTFLLLDTSGTHAVLALASEGGAVEASSIFLGRRTLSRRLMGQIDSLLTGNGLTLGDISAFAVGVGPGSFTGVRVGVTTAKTLAQVTGLPLVGISTLDAYAVGWEKCSSVIAPILPSRKNEVYSAIFQAGQMQEAPFAESYEAIIARLEALSRARPLIACGDIGFLPPNRFATFAQPFVPPTGLAMLAARRLAADDTDDPFGLVPLYVVAPSISTPRDLGASVVGERSTP